MKNKSSFNSGRGGRISGTGPNNSSVIAGSSKVGGYSEAEIVNLSRRKIGEDYNKFQDRIKKDFEKYLRESTADWNDANLDLRFNIILSFFLNQQQQDLEMISAIADLRQSISQTAPEKEIEQKIDPKQLSQVFNNKNVPKALLALILVLVTTELVIRSSDESTATVNKVTNAVALGIAGGAIAGPVGSVAGIIVGGLVNEVEANKITLHRAIYEGNAKAVKEILASAKDKPIVLEKILTKFDKENGASPLNIAAYKGNAKIVKEILASVKDNSALLEKILTKVDKEGMPPLYRVAYKGNAKIVKKILASVKDNPKLLEKILTQVEEKNGASPLHIAASEGNFEVATEILATTKYNPELFNILIKHKPKKNIKSHLTVLDHLLMAKNDEAIKIILEVNPNEVGEKLPNIYYSDIPKTAIYYLEAFLKTDQNLAGTKIKYFELDKNSKPKEIKIDSSNLSAGNDNPTIIEIKNDGKTRRILLATDIDFAENEEVNLKKAIILNNKKLGFDKVIFNLSVTYPEGTHAITIKLTKNNAKNGWNVVFHDPNTHVFVSLQKDDWRKINEETITELCQNVGIKIISLKEAKAIIPNHYNQNIGGSCDMISSIAAASMILGKEHSEQLREKCNEIGVRCIEVLGQELNPEIDKILAARLQFIKNSLKPETKEAGPSFFVEEAKAEKLRSKSVHAEL